jgi:hypothetical protein
MNYRNLSVALSLISLFAVAHPLTGATIPPGTILTVSTLDPISSHDRPGRTFRAKLDQAVVIEGKTVLKAGAHISGVVETSRGKPNTRDALRVNITNISQHGENVMLKTTGGVYPNPKAQGVQQAATGISLNEGTIAAGTKFSFKLAEPLNL